MISRRTLAIIVAGVAVVAAAGAFAYDADRLRGQLAVQRAKPEPLLALIDARRRRLAVLMGKPPEAAAALPPPTPLHIVPPQNGYVPVQVPKRRPDVRARAARVQAQMGQATATAQLYRALGSGW